VFITIARISAKYISSLFVEMAVLIVPLHKRFALDVWTQTSLHFSSDRVTPLGRKRRKTKALTRGWYRCNSTSKLPEASGRLLEQFICQDYETLKQKTRYASRVGLKLSCENQGITAPSYKTFCVAVRRRPSFDQTVNRKGRPASYQVEVFYWELDLKTPRHGDRPFEIVHIDHTPLG
jgi:hypothetical protein